MFRGALEPWHLLILVLIVVILFGWKKLPDAARSLGRSARILKSELGDDDHKSSASGQTVPGQTQPRSGGAPGEAPVPGAAGYPQQGQQQSAPQQPNGYVQVVPPTKVQACSADGWLIETEMHIDVREDLIREQGGTDAFRRLVPSGIAPIGPAGRNGGRMPGESGSLVRFGDSGM